MRRGFTIVELLIVVVVIAILAAITVVAYNGITRQATEAVLKSDLESAAKSLHIAKVDGGSFPALPFDLKSSNGVTLRYIRIDDGASFCVDAVSSRLPGAYFNIKDSASIQSGECPPAPLGFMQNINNSNCPATRTAVVDARDNRTYFVQRMDDGKCWMLTNLAYAGGTSNGGVNTFNDAKNIGTLSSTSNYTYDAPRFYSHANASPKLNPTEPSSNTAGGGTAGGGGRQYGYLYNWCAALGAQTGTSACSEAAGPLPDAAVSVCPAQWRLPTSGAGGDFEGLKNAFGVSGPFYTKWLVQYSGYQAGGAFTDQGTNAYLWSSTQRSPNFTQALGLSVNQYAIVGDSGANYKATGAALRCVAQ